MLINTVFETDKSVKGFKKAKTEKRILGENNMSCEF